ncbi:GTP-binding protein gtr1 [Cystobasidiomycetes sp. EMM_F5]
MKRKVLLMGRSGAGKTSMRAIIFDNVVARQTTTFGATIDVNNSTVRFWGDLQLDLWDCGGQQSFMDQYLDGRRNTIFAQVHTLIYIFDVQKTTASDLVYFGNILDALQAGSGIGVASRSKQRQRDDEDSSEENSDGEHSISGESGPRVHILLHKMDLVESGERQHVYEQRAVEARAKCKAAGFERVQIFATSIYNETLYTAWSEIVSTLNPHVTQLSKYLSRFSDVIGASEVVLFERTTLLVVSQSRSKHTAAITNGDAQGQALSDQHQLQKLNGDRADEPESEWPEDRCAKIAQAIKLFRLGCK